MSLFDRFLGGMRGGSQDGPARGDPERVAAAERVLEELRPLIALDGGEIRLVAVEDDWVLVRLVGACKRCQASAYTLHGALEPRLRERLPWFRGLRAVER